MWCSPNSLQLIWPGSPRIDIIEKAALKELWNKIAERKHMLLKAFLAHDPKHTGWPGYPHIRHCNSVSHIHPLPPGKMPLSDWCDVMGKTVDVESIPWRSLSSKFVEVVSPL